MTRSLLSLFTSVGGGAGFTALSSGIGANFLLGTLDGVKAAD